MTKRQPSLRAALAVLALAYALALTGFLGARLMGGHAAASASPALAICAEHGPMTLPAGTGGAGHERGEHPGCPCGPLCAGGAFPGPGAVAVLVPWSPVASTGPGYPDLSVRPLGSRAPPDLKAQGPPVRA